MNISETGLATARAQLSIFGVAMLWNVMPVNDGLQWQDVNWEQDWSEDRFFIVFLLNVFLGGKSLALYIRETSGVIS